MIVEVRRFLALYTRVHNRYETRLKNELESARKTIYQLGYTIEQGYGTYLWAPNKERITMDWWNE